eukprot:gene2718-3914_t
MSINTSLFFIPLGIFDFILFVIAIIWTICSRGLLKAFSLQRQLFFCMGLNRFIRVIQILLIYQICPITNKAHYCETLSHVAQALDLTASLLNLTTYLTLAMFWAEEYHSIKLHNSNEFQINLKKIQFILQMVFWFIILIAFGYIAFIMLLIFSVEALSSNTIAYKITRLAFRVTTSLLIAIFLSLYGFLIIKEYRMLNRSNKRLFKIAIITSISTITFLILTLGNIIKFLITSFGNDAIISLEQNIGWVVSNLSGYLELFTIGLLMFSLTPKRITQVICCCEFKNLSLDETLDGNYADVPDSLSNTFEEPDFKYYFKEDE